MVAFASAAMLECPLAIEEVAQQGREDTRDDLGDHRLLFEHRQAQRVEDHEVEDHRRATYDGELDQLAVPNRKVPDGLG